MNINDFGDVNEKLRNDAENSKEVYSELLAFLVFSLTLLASSLIVIILG